MMHGTTEALSSGMPFDGRALPLPAFSPNRLRTEPSAAPLPPAVALTSQTAGAEADATRPPLDELTWDDLYISQELRTAYFYYKLGVSRLMNNQQSFLVATLKQNNCPVLSHEQIAAIQMKQDPLDWKSFHLRPSKWSTKYYTSTELHRAYMYYSEELSRFSHVGRSAQQMEKALNSAECPVLTRYEIADIQRRRKREMQAAATAVGSPDGQAQPSVLRKRRVVRRRTGLVDSDVVLPARTRKRAPVSPADSEEESKVPSFGQSLQEFAAPRPMKRVRQTRPVQRPASPVASYSSLAESPLNSLSLLPSFSFTPIQQQHYPAPAPAQLPHFPLPEYPYALPSAPSFLAQAPMAQPPAPSHGMVVGPLSLSGSDDLMGSPFKFFENDPFFSLQNESANPQSPLSVSSAEWDSGHSDLSHSPVGGSPIDDLMASPSNVAALTLPSSVVPAPVQMSGYPMQSMSMPTSMPMPLQLSVPAQQQFTFSDLAGMSQPTQYQSQTQAYQQQYQSQSRQSFVPPPQYAIAPDQSFGLLDGVVGWN